MEIVYVLLALAFGLVIGFLLGNSRKNGVTARAEMLERQLDDAKAESEKAISTLKAEHREELDSLRLSHKEDMQNLRDQQKEALDQQIRLLTEQISTTTEKVLKDRSKELSTTNKEQLAQILNPLQAGIKQMQDSVDKSRMERTESMASLKSAITLTVQQTEKLGEKTDNLTNALSRDNKYQGNFGEMQLRKMLEDMGLERGRHFEEQVTLRDESGEAIKDDDNDRRMQPDVILHFPDSRDIIIDSKVSLTAFLRHQDTSLPDADRQQALKEHVASVKNQVRLLASKSYWRQYNQRGLKLDFVVMFMCSENALQLALSEEPQLWDDAYRQGVLITGPQNLYALLRILEISWKQMAQVENQQNIIDCANEIVGRVQLFYKRFLDAETELRKTQESFDNLKNSVAPSGQSIVNSANKLLKYGAKEDSKRKKSLPKEDPVQTEDLPEPND